jgi:hypothetical protein
MQVNDTLEVIVDDLPLRAVEWWHGAQEHYTPAIITEMGFILNLYEHHDEIDAQETPEGKRMLIGMLVAAAEVKSGKNRD